MHIHVHVYTCTCTCYIVYMYVLYTVNVTTASALYVQCTSQPLSEEWAPLAINSHSMTCVYTLKTPSIVYTVYCSCTTFSSRTQGSSCAPTESILNGTLIHHLYHPSSLGSHHLFSPNTMPFLPAPQFRHPSPFFRSLSLSPDIFSGQRVHVPQAGLGRESGRLETQRELNCSDLWIFPTFDQWSAHACNVASPHPLMISGAGPGPGVFLGGAYFRLSRFTCYGYTHARPRLSRLRIYAGNSWESVRSVIADPEVSMMSEERPIVITESENDDGEKQHTDINSDDLQTLDDKEWLNDKVSTLALFYIFIAAGFFAHFFQVMLKYLSLLQSEGEKVHCQVYMYIKFYYMQRTKRKITLLNSFFSEKLLSSGVSGYEGVRGYFKKVCKQSETPDLVQIFHNTRKASWTVMVSLFFSMTEEHTGLVNISHTTIYLYPI